MDRLLVLALTALVARGATAQEEKHVKECLDRITKAVGEEKKLSGVGAYTMRVKGKVFANGEVITVSGDWSMRGLDRFRWEAQADVQGRNITSTVLVKGDRSWLTGVDGKGNPVPGETAKALHINTRLIRFMQSPQLLREKGVMLSSLGELKFEGREVFGLKVQVKDFPDVDVFYDKKTNLPVKCETRLEDVMDGQEVLHTLRFDEFKTKDGLTHFTSFRFQRDEKTALELELSDINPQETLDDSVFAEPEKR